MHLYILYCHYLPVTVYCCTHPALSAKTLQLVRALPSLDDEVNVATFHPVPGVGIVYGTKEGRLRMLRYDK